MFRTDGSTNLPTYLRTNLPTLPNRRPTKPTDLPTELPTEPSALSNQRIYPPTRHIQYIPIEPTYTPTYRRTHRPSYRPGCQVYQPNHRGPTYQPDRTHLVLPLPHHETQGRQPVVVLYQGLPKVFTAAPIGREGKAREGKGRDGERLTATKEA